MMVAIKKYFSLKLKIFCLLKMIYGFGIQPNHNGVHVRAKIFIHLIAVNVSKKGIKYSDFLSEIFL